LRDNHNYRIQKWSCGGCIKAYVQFIAQIDIIIRKGIRQILLERGINFSPADCLQQKHVKAASEHNKKVKEAWEADRENVQLLQQILTMKDAIVVSVEAKEIVCNCARCVLSKQEDFYSQKSGLEEV
jgi:hypothetical protein